MSADYVIIDLFAKSNCLLETLYEGYDQVIEKGIDKLKGFDVDLVITAILPNNSNFYTILQNLESIDLPLKTGVLIGVERTPAHYWQRALEAALKLVRSRFIFVEIIETSTLSQTLVREALGHHLVRFKDELRFFGIEEDDYWIEYIKMCKREELRLIIKSLNCKYVLWLDWLSRLPKDTLQKLLCHTNKADVVSAWCFEDHLGVKATNVLRSKPYKNRSKRDKTWYENYENQVNKYKQFLNIASLGSYSVSGDVNYPIPYWYLEQWSEIIDLSITGFNCVLVNKKTNDDTSFIGLFDRVCGDVNFAKTATEQGKRLVCAPECHVERDDIKRSQILLVMRSIL